MLLIRFSFFFGLLLLLSCQRGWQAETARVQQYRIATAQDIQADTAVVAMLAPYKAQLEAKMNVVLGEAGMELTKVKPESTLGNWVADLTQEMAEFYYGQNIDFAIANYGGLRISQIPVGPVTRGKIFELMPFDNQLVIVKTNGEVVQQLFDRMADYGGWPVSAPVRFRIQEGKPVDIRIGGKPLVEDQTYLIAMSDFVANGGDRCFFFADQERIDLGQGLRDAMIEYVIKEQEAGRQLSAKVEGRVTQ